MQDIPAEVIYSHFRHFLDWSIFYQFSHKFRICAVLLFSVTIVWGCKRIPYHVYLYNYLQNHPSFSISQSSGKIKHMFISINNLSSTTLIIYSSRTLLIFNFTHHLFFQNTFNFSSRFEQVNTRIEAYSKINLFPCYFL